MMQRDVLRLIPKERFISSAEIKKYNKGAGTLCPQLKQLCKFRFITRITMPTGPNYAYRRLK